MAGIKDIVGCSVTPIRRVLKENGVKIESSKTIAKKERYRKLQT